MAGVFLGRCLACRPRRAEEESPTPGRSVARPTNGLMATARRAALDEALMTLNAARKL
jgi:hypothetical protein